MKKFIITIDTESDNQWNTDNKQTTENAKYIPRFQELCEKYGFKPVYLIDYSMAHDEFLVTYLSDCVARGTCEVGMHLHAWDTPPFVETDMRHGSRPYLIEYPPDVMEAKIKTMSDLLREKFCCEIISHRAGRWAMDEEYFMLLAKYGYKVDCSYTPGINWSKTPGATRGGSDFSNVNRDIHFEDNGGLLEVPATIRKIRFMKKVSLKEIAKFVLGRNIWLRPALFDNDEMIGLVQRNRSSVSEFMMHSSELMPGGSPYFKSKEDIEELYSRLESFFAFIRETHEGTTLKELYYSISKEEQEVK